MSGIELNKIAAAILLAALIATIAGTVADILYKPKLEPEQRGYEIEVAEEEAGAGSEKKEEKIDIEQLIAQANAESGKRIAKKCVSCHSFEKGGANKIGPNLWNVIGDKKGHRSDFAYSRALLEKGGVWDNESLYAFLNKPGKYIPGTKMSFAGLRKPQDIADVIKYMQQYSSK